MTGPYFESWEHENLVKFAKDAYAKLQKQEEELQRLRSQWPERQEPFVVKHYSGDERPIVKGNGFDGLEVGQDREEAQAFADWVNARLAPPQRQPLTEEEIVACIDDVFDFALNNGNIDNRYVIRFARAIERAHGIGGGE